MILDGLRRGSRLGLYRMLIGSQNLLQYETYACGYSIHMFHR